MKTRQPMRRAGGLWIPIALAAAGGMAGVEDPANVARDREDVVFRALADELGRSMERLKLEQHGGPYYLEYTVKESDAFQVMASFGALTSRSRQRARGLDVDLRVGNYALDNTNFGGRGFGGFGGFRGDLTADDDYDALRQAIWLRTDAAYKEAIEELEAKKAYLQENTVEDRPDDLSREAPVVAVEPTVRLAVDEDRWAGAARKISAVFRDFPRIQKSMVLFMAEGENRWFLNNEGFKNRSGKVECGVVMLASLQADDGMRLGDMEMVAGRGEQDLPPLEELEKSARELAARLTRLAEAPVAEEYRGPILLEGQAAAEFFAQTLASHLGRSHEPLGGRGGRGGNQLREKIGTRILPASITVEDDPAAREFAGVPLLGGFAIDDDGVRAEKVTLVEKGILKTFCMSRIPTRKLKKSNGHSRGGVGAPSILFVRAEEALAPAALRKELLKLGQEEGLTHVLLARRIGNSLAAALNPQMMMSSMRAMGRGGGVALMPPVLLYRVSVEDGKEELVRGASFGGLTLRVLRDITAAGDDARPYLVAQGMNEGGHLIAPSILLKEIESEKPPKETEKPPALVNPFFEK